VIVKSSVKKIEVLFVVSEKNLQGLLPKNSFAFVRLFGVLSAFIGEISVYARG
jgi:hypothetical protein